MDLLSRSSAAMRKSSRTSNDRRNANGLEFFDPRTRHSHRNSKPSQQMLLAESLYEPDTPFSSNSRLAITFSDLQSDRFAQAYFDAFAETLPSETKSLIKVWIRICRFHERQVPKMSAKSRESEELGEKNEMKSAKLEEGEMGRKARSILHKCSADPYIRNLVPQAVTERLEQQISCSDLKPEMFEPVLQAIEAPAALAFQSFLSSQFFLKYQIDIMTKGLVTLSDVIFYDATLFYFMDFMEKEGMRKYLDFILIMNSYRNVETPSQLDSEIIWSKFFDRRSGSDMRVEEEERTQNLHLSDAICDKVRRKIDNNEPNSFDLPAAILHQYLDRTYFKQFLESQEYFDVTTEMIKSFQRKQIDNPVCSSKCGSADEISVTESCSSRQTTTDMPSSPGQGDWCRDGVRLCRTEDRQRNERETSSDNNYHENMWNRCRSRLQIAHIDPYGRVISDLEPEPDKKEERSHFSKSIRKLVTRSGSNQDSNQALAWKVAQMIIDDVVNVTTEFT